MENNGILLRFTRGVQICRLESNGFYSLSTTSNRKLFSVDSQDVEHKHNKLPFTELKFGQVRGKTFAINQL